MRDDGGGAAAAAAAHRIMLTKVHKTCCFMMDSFLGWLARNSFVQEDYTFLYHSELTASAGAGQHPTYGKEHDQFLRTCKATADQ